MARLSELMLASFENVRVRLLEMSKSLLSKKSSNLRRCLTKALIVVAWWKSGCWMWAMFPGPKEQTFCIKPRQSIMYWVLEGQTVASTEHSTNLG